MSSSSMIRAMRPAISDETREKMRRARLGKKHSPETRAKMSAAAKARKRRPHSEETRRRIGEAKRGQTHTPEARAKMSASHLGVPLREEHRRNMAAALPRGERHHRWKGDAVGYDALHSWLTRNYAKAGICEDCGESEKPTEWANVTGQYVRAREHYRELCVSCHRGRDLSKARTRPLCELLN